MPLTIVMYHYVRPISGSKFPGIKGLEVQQFSGQLDYLLMHYEAVSVEQVIEARRAKTSLPKNAILLTFDDGYRDHLNYAFPLLRKAGIPAAFFPVSEVVQHRRLLDVNKIHFVLASGVEPEIIIPRVEELVDKAREIDKNLPSINELRQKWRHPTRLDSADVIYVKRLLQTALPNQVRSKIASNLFHDFVTADERQFADELYMDIDDLRQLRDAGMHIGGHSAHHHWMGSLDRDKQMAEISGSLGLNHMLGIPLDEFTFCYPFGDFNDTTLELLETAGCKAAFTCEVSLADQTGGDMLRLPRLDTNDLPMRRDADVNAWTRQVLAENGQSL